MPFELPALPYDIKALAPHLSRETVIQRHSQTQRACVARLNQLVEGTPWANASLEAILLGAEGELARQAAQAWAFIFHWHSLSPQGGAPDDALGQAIAARWGDITGLRQAIATAASDASPGGWVWLVRDAQRLEVMAGDVHDLPLSRGLTPLLVHHLTGGQDTDTAAGLDAFWALANWRFAAANFSGLSAPAAC
ncbi:superoxide dismutase [Halomonas icarae]|uniref:Superoxide dismutase n=1 Tax=Halomonas icarae TaxID=2691040 RepID=A0A7X5ALV0_9GAMM|nr:Fe-Mn family superoxide dismutase [Halomonas icarae]MDR5902121.1 Fe-Mn family superoxide dismutase [Halomonas icarae]NAW12179.1 superoxide dismutase [Fe] [Halomonas icarae]